MINTFSEKCDYIVVSRKGEMELEVSLKIHQEDILSSFTEKFQFKSQEETILALIQNSLAHDKREDIFGEDNMQCSSGCFNAEPCVKLHVKPEIFNELLEIFASYVSEDYDSDEERISKTIRCMIEYYDQHQNEMKNVS